MKNKWTAWIVRDKHTKRVRVSHIFGGLAPEVFPTKYDAIVQPDEEAVRVVIALARGKGKR